MHPFTDPAVARVFQGYPARVRRKLLALRELIFATAHATDGVRARFPREFTFAGNRALAFRVDAAVPQDALARCITQALTYHLRKKRRPKGVKR